MGQVITTPLFFASDAIYPLQIMPEWLVLLVALVAVQLVAGANVQEHRRVKRPRALFLPTRSIRSTQCAARGAGHQRARTHRDGLPANQAALTRVAAA